MSQFIEQLESHIASLLRGDYHDPHALLGLHQGTIRFLSPGANEAYLEVGGEIVRADKVHPDGLFEYHVAEELSPTDYRIYWPDGALAHDPYAFLPHISESDLFLFGKGVHYEIYNLLGAHLVDYKGVNGVHLAVWAPTAHRVSLVTDANRWDGRTHPMRSMGSSGIWALFIPDAHAGMKYKFEVKTYSGEIKIKSDPYARYSELRPANASVVYEADRHEWHDKQWMESRGGVDRPINIYEVHLGSWKRADGSFLNYRDLAHRLAEYCRDLHFTHVELLPVTEHPLDESWGYQVSGYFATTSRFGTPTDFQYFVDTLHQAGIGVILDWVPAHFPVDEFALGHFDGSCLYEHFDRKKGWHPQWETNIFNYGRNEVGNFLICSALYWLDKMHIDGLRVDAVASMLYLDYGREAGEWEPNEYGGRENLEAIEFLKHLNSVVHERFPTALTIAEESTAFQGVSHPLDEGGLGFDLKWNMGWMNDTLRYFSKDPIYRSHHQNDLTFGLVYAFNERFCLPLSHDEVVHGKRSLISKMPGDVWQRFANLRLLYSYMICQPGKKLLFMGQEFGQWHEWNCSEELNWHLLEQAPHFGMREMVRDLNLLYKEQRELWVDDFSPSGFEWLDFSDTRNCVLSYRRKSPSGTVICVHNFTPNYHSEYLIRAGDISVVTELFNSDSLEYGGSGKVNPNIEILPGDGFKFQLAPLATMIYEIR